MSWRSDDELLADLSRRLSLKNKTVSLFQDATAAEWDELFVACGLVPSLYERVSLRKRVKQELSPRQTTQHTVSRAPAARVARRFKLLCASSSLDPART